MRLFKLIVIIGFTVYTHTSIACSCVSAMVNGLAYGCNVETSKVYRGTIEIQNTDDVPQTVKLYISDYSYTVSREINDDLVDNNKNSSCSPIQMNATYLEFSSKEKKTTLYDINKMPEDSTLKGFYWNLVMDELIDKIQSTDAKVNIKLRNVMLYTIKIITKASNNKPNHSQRFIDSKITDNMGGKGLLEIDMETNVELCQKIKASVEFYNDTDGMEKDIFKSQLLSLLPSNSKGFAIDVTNIPFGYYKVIVLADCNDGNVFWFNLT